jgi:hypothetical protein
MSRKHFSWLLITTLVVAAVVLLVPGKTGKESSFETSRLLPDLQDQVNDLAWLRFTAAGGEIVATLQRAEEQWRVGEAHGYPADWERLRKLLADLAQAEIIEPKTSNPQYYDRLGVQDVSLADASGIRIDFSEGSGLPALIVGETAQGRSGHYVRLDGAEQSALIDREFDIPENAEGWLEQNIVDIADAEVVQVDITHGDGERLQVRKAAADDEDFQLQSMPEGREIRSAWALNSLAGGLSALSLEAVSPAADLDWSAAVRYALVTADGLRIDAQLLRPVAAGEEGAAGGGHWIRLEAGLYQTALESGVTAPEDPSDTNSSAEEINRRVSGWAYRIPEYKYDTMTKRMEDVLKTVDSAES